MPEWWQQNNYLAGRQISEDLWICVSPMLFTWRLILCTKTYIMEGYDYPDLQTAMDAYETWDGITDPMDGWVRDYAGRRR